MSDRDELIAKARELSAAATPGPWNWANWGEIGEPETTLQAERPADERERSIWGPIKQIALVRNEENDLSPGDRAFLAESRTLLPALADLAESLIADQKEYNAESIRHHCEWMNKRAEFYAIIERVSKERDAARAEVERLKLEVAALRAERDHLATTRMEASAEIDRLQTERAALAQENARLTNEVGTLDAIAREQRQRAEVLARGIAAYRSGSFTLAQVWENEEGKAVT